MTDTTGAERLSEEMALPAPNLPLLRKVLDHIDAHPDEWDQSSWVASEAERIEWYGMEEGCGTAYCIAGHAVAMTEPLVTAANGSVHPSSSEYWEDAGRAALGLTEMEADLLFHGDNSRADVQRFARQIAVRAGEVL